MEESEQIVIKKCQLGDLEQFGFLYEKYIRKIYDFIFYKTHHKETAEDIASEVFMKALESINQFDPCKGTFQAWIYQIARNKTIDHYRTKKTDENIDDAWDISGNEDPAGEIDARNKLEKIKRYIKNLESRQRDVLIMRIWQEMSYKEISEILNFSEANCKMTYSRAIRKLRSEMPLSLLVYFLIFYKLY
jgi:RNA polymerase sigma-70 factor, ECF subfamily